MPWEEAALFRKNSTIMPDSRWSSSLNFKPPIFYAWFRGLQLPHRRYRLTTEPSMTCSDMVVLLLRQLGLNGFEHILIDNRFLLSRQDLSL